MNIEAEGKENLNKSLSGYFRNDGELAKLVRGALISCIDAHGPITKEYVSSAQRRVTKAIFGSARQKLEGLGNDDST